MTTDDRIEELTVALGTVFRESVHAEGRAMMRHLILLLAEGQPVSLERVAVALERSLDEVATTLRQLPNVEFDDTGNVVGAGLTFRPTPHRFTVNDQTMFTWCALDALMFPGLMGQTVQVESPCAATGTTVRVKVTANGVEQIEPPDALVSLVVPEVSPDIRGSFCCNVNFFSSDQAASQWLSEHPSAITLPIREAYQLGHRLGESVFKIKGDGAQQRHAADGAARRR
ncbi:MAG: organomercurial lyase MerB [Actinomycetota bacterium]